MILHQHKDKFKQAIQAASQHLEIREV
jgi:hypothetical protein